MPRMEIEASASTMLRTGPFFTAMTLFGTMLLLMVALMKPSLALTRNFIVSSRLRSDLKVLTFMSLQLSGLPGSSCRLQFSAFTRPVAWS